MSGEYAPDDPEVIDHALDVLYHASGQTFENDDALRARNMFAKKKSPAKAPSHFDKSVLESRTEDSYKPSEDTSVNTIRTKSLIRACRGVEALESVLSEACIPVVATFISKDGKEWYVIDVNGREYAIADFNRLMVVK